MSEEDKRHIDPEWIKGLADEYLACMAAMDRHGVPRTTENGLELTLFGRALWMEKNGEL